MKASVRNHWSEIDSVKNGFNASVDSLSINYSYQLNAVDKETSLLRHRIDSLSRVNLSTSHLSSKLDSLGEVRKKAIAEFEGKMSVLKSKTIRELNGNNVTSELAGPVNELARQIDDVDINPGGLGTAPQLQAEGLCISTDEVGSLKEASNIAGLPNMGTPVGSIDVVGTQVKGVGEDIGNLANGNLDQVKAVPQAMEQQAGQMEGVRDLQKQGAVLDQYHTRLETLRDPEAMQEQGKEMAVKEAINHFAGKEDVLKSAMDEVSKYKRTYNSVANIKDLPKGPVNAMKGTPFIERLVPGMFLQYQQKNVYLLDVNPYLGYRISGRFTAGLGWNQRLVLARGNENNSLYRVFGPRAYFDTGLGKGFIAHLELEYINTYVPSKLTGVSDDGNYQWVSVTMVGLKKNYQICKNLRGTVLVQYNLYNPGYMAPYVDRINSRIGFEYTLRKRPKSSQ